MYKHVVFLLHGVGKHREDWADGHAQLIKETCDQVLSDNNIDPNFELEFVELTYGHILDENMVAMVNGSSGWGEVHEFLSAGMADRNTEGHEPANTKEQIAGALRDYAMDVPTYVLNNDFSTGLLADLATQITAKIQQYGNSARYSLITHSLGTKVGFDLLHKLYLGNEYYSVNDQLGPTAGSPTFQNFYQIASVAWVMGKFDGQSYTPNNSHVRVRKPVSTGMQYGIVRNAYRVYNNKYDLIARIGQANKFNANAITSLEELPYINKLWMHDFDLYLKNPRVYLTLVEDLFKVNLDENYKKEKIDSYENDEDNISQQADQVFEELHDVIHGKFDEIDYIQFAKNLYEINKKFQLLDI